MRSMMVYGLMGGVALGLTGCDEEAERAREQTENVELDGNTDSGNDDTGEGKVGEAMDRWFTTGDIAELDVLGPSDWPAMESILIDTFLRLGDDGMAVAFPRLAAANAIDLEESGSGANPPPLGACANWWGGVESNYVAYWATMPSGSATLSPNCSSREDAFTATSSGLYACQSSAADPYDNLVSFWLGAGGYGKTTWYLTSTSLGVRTWMLAKAAVHLFTSSGRNLRRYQYTGEANVYTCLPVAYSAASLRVGYR